MGPRKRKLAAVASPRSCSIALQMILSPAKTMKFEAHAVADAVGPPSDPVGLAQANELARVLAEQSAGRLKETLGVSDALASLNRDRFKGWASAPRRAAVIAYDGMAYDKLRGRDLSAEELRVAHSRLVILSGLFGPVRALDWIKPYRLEMACKKVPGSPKLADLWKETATRALLDGFTGANDKLLLLNVASDEYAAAVDFEALEREGVSVVKADFRDASGKRMPTVHLKHARGLLARFVITNDANDRDSLLAFDLEDYAYDPVASTHHLLVFKKNSNNSSSSSSSNNNKETDPPAGPPPNKQNKKRRRTTKAPAPRL